MKRSTLGILAFVLLSLAAVQRGLGQSYAYVCNVSADTVTAIDLESQMAVATVAVGDEPYYVVLTPDGSRAYVTNRNSNTVSVIDTVTNTVLTTIRVGVTPWQLAITPDGSRIYVVNYGQSDQGSVSVISTATNTVVATIPIGNWPRAIAMTPDGTKAYIACQRPNSVSVIDTVNNVWLKDIYMSLGDSWPGSIAMSPDGTTVCVGNVVTNSLAVINTATDALVRSFRLPICPDDIAFKPDGLQLYVTTSSRFLSIVDVLAGTVTGTIEVCPEGTSLAEIAMGSGGDRAYVAGQGCGIVGVIDTASNTLVASIPAGPTPLGIAVVPTSNRPPVADFRFINANAGEPTPVYLTATDEDGDVLTYEIISWPSRGALEGDAPNLIYTPDVGYWGPDSFAFRVYDGTEYSNDARVTIDVNHVPYVGDQTVTLEQNTGVTIVLGDTIDIDEDPLTYQVIVLPGSGSCRISANQAVYMPAAGYFGTDSFTFQATDTKANSNIGTIYIEVTRLNTAPVAQSQTVIATWNSDVFITLGATDAEGDPLTYHIVDQPDHGQLSGTGPIMTLTLEAGFSGSDSFTFKVNDGWLDSEIGMVSIRVQRPYTPPVAQDQLVTTDEDHPVNITLTATDEDGDPLTYSTVTQPTHGQLSGTAPNLIYSPQTGYFGSDSFTFKVNDGRDDSGTATVSITVNQVNSPPVAQSQTVIATWNSDVFITLGATDAESDPLTYHIVDQPDHGQLSGTGPIMTLTLEAGFSGSDSFTFKVNDGWLDSEIRTVSIRVQRPYTPPVAQDQSVTTDEDHPVNITLTATDEDGDPLTYSIVTPPASGELSGTPPDLTYTPQIDYYGPDSFTFKVNDGRDDSGTATVSITVNQVNSPPVAQGQPVTTDEDHPVNITLTATDEDGDPLTYIILTPPAHGELTGTGPDQIYSPQTGYYGSDSFTFKVNDSWDDSGTATVSITVNQVNSPPVAQGQSVTTDENQQVSITLTATDEDGDPLTYIILTPPAHGELTGTAPNLIYTPLTYYYGPDVFTFKVHDGTVDSGMGAVSITVKRVFAFTGFESPVDNPIIVNSVKAGSTVPVKWLITELDGTPIADPASFVSLTSYSISCNTLAGDPVNAVEAYFAGVSGLQYIGDGHWQFNWKTPKGYAGQCQAMVLTLADGSTHTAYFTFN